MVTQARAISRAAAAVVTVIVGAACSPTVTAEEARASLCAHLLPLRAPYAVTLPGSVHLSLVESLSVDAGLLRAAGLVADADQVAALVKRMVDESEPGDPPVDLSVFLQAAVTKDQRTKIGETLEEHPEVTSVRYESRQEAYRRYVELFHRYPDLIENVNPDALPESFRVDIREGADREEVRETVSGLPGVEEAVRGANEPSILYDFDLRAEVAPLVADCPPVQSGPP